MKEYLIPTKVIVNKAKRTVVLKWLDETVTKAVCDEKDNMDILVGFYIAYYKRVHKDLGLKAIREKLLAIEKDALLNRPSMMYPYLLSVFYENCNMPIEKSCKFIRFLTNRFCLEKDIIIIDTPIDFLHNARINHIESPPHIIYYGLDSIEHALKAYGYRKLPNGEVQSIKYSK